MKVSTIKQLKYHLKATRVEFQMSDEELYCQLDLHRHFIALDRALAKFIEIHGDAEVVETVEVVGTKRMEG